MGIAYETYSPMVAMDVAAENATVDPREGRPRKNESVHASQTVRTGVLDRLLTLWKKVWPGRPPSRANAYIMRELDVTENVLNQDKIRKKIEIKIN